MSTFYDVDPFKNLSRIVGKCIIRASQENNVGRLKLDLDDGTSLIIEGGEDFDYLGGLQPITITQQATDEPTRN